MRSGAQDVPRKRPKAGPTNPTPLALTFYKAFKDSDFRSYEELAESIGDIRRSTVSAIINGTRGGSRRDSGTNIRRIAAALGIDPDRAVELAGSAVHTDVQDVERAVRALNWPREAQDELISVLREMDRTRRRRR